VSRPKRRPRRYPEPEHSRSNSGAFCRGIGGGPGDAHNLCSLMIDATHLKARTKGGPNYKLPAVTDGLTGRDYPHRLCGLKSRRVSRIWPGFCRVRREWRVPAGICREAGSRLGFATKEAPRDGEGWRRSINSSLGLSTRSGRQRAARSKE
jgi:hypothetical protein